MAARRRIVPVVLMAFASTSCLAIGQESGARLDFANAIKMLNCDPASAAPCFRIELNIVNSQGSPVPSQIPAPDKLLEALTIHVDGRDITPFYAVAQSMNGTASVRGRVALILVDVSGSMNQKLPNGQTRFEAAKAGVLQFLDGFEDGVDSVAITSFESHNVETGIRNARFATTKIEALQQLDALSRPGPKNNTALYSAIVTGLDVITHTATQSKSGAGSESLLIVMTDGRNEILRGDDPGLLAGEEGLTQAARKSQSAGTQVVGIGFGNATEVDEVALRRISTRYYGATNTTTLKQVFSFARTLLNNRISATFGSPYPDRASLAGRTLRVSARLKLPSGTMLSSNEKTWSTPQMGIPAFAGECDSDEKNALFSRNSSSDGSWTSFVRPVCVFLGLGVLLIVLWFWVPRLVWPEQYIGVLPTPSRWASGRSRRFPHPTPPGFTAATGVSPRLPVRTPADATIVQPKSDFTKTRLNRDG